MKNCPLCGAEYSNRVFILKMLRALSSTIVSSDGDTITIQVPEEAN